MQELLSKTVDQNVPLREQEFFELSLLDEPNQLGTRYYVRQTHARIAPGKAILFVGA